MSDGEREQVEVLPLVDGDGRGRAGWCTAGFSLTTPDVEVMCGGINTKLPSHAGVWRQGHLLHFGFQQDPNELNANGRKLLANSIAYIARFTEDRPIAQNLSPIGKLPHLMSRHFMDYTLESPDRGVDSIAAWFHPSSQAELEEASKDEAVEWVRANWCYLLPHPEGKLHVDPDARALQLPIDAPDLPARVLELLADPERRNRTKGLLARLVPAGPGPDADAEAWQAWLTENGRFFFFSELGGYQWLVDPLAKRRDVPSGELRGERRATNEE